MAEAWFYHLERQPLESVLPRIVIGLTQRGECVCIHVPSADVLDELSRQLWAYEETGFMAHGVDGDAAGARHKLWLTSGQDDPLGAAQRIYCGGAMPADALGMARVMIFISPGDQACLDHARAAWKSYKSQGVAVRYWRQAENGRWEDQAAARAA